jgi:hypothetical protein
MSTASDNSQGSISSCFPPVQPTTSAKKKNYFRFFFFILTGNLEVLLLVQEVELESAGIAQV